VESKLVVREDIVGFHSAARAFRGLAKIGLFSFQVLAVFIVDSRRIELIS
jgi:hypothetical protein